MNGLHANGQCAIDTPIAVEMAANASGSGFLMPISDDPNARRQLLNVSA